MSSTNFCQLACTKGAVQPNMLGQAACFIDGFIETTITADKYDDWGQCRVMRKHTCDMLEEGLDTLFDGKMISGINMLKGMGSLLQDTMATCKPAYLGHAKDFGSWVLGVGSDPENLGFTLTKSLYTQPSQGYLADAIGDMINNVFAEKYYYGAGSNLGLLVN